MPATQTYPGKRRGMKPGQRNSGQFAAGRDIRRHRQEPSEMNGWRDELGELCRTHTGDAVEFLTSTMMDEDRPDAIRMEATDKLLSYGYGRPVTREAHLLLGAQKAADATPQGDISLLDTATLMRIAAGSLNTLETPIEGEVVPEQIKDVPKPRQRRRKAL